MIKNMNITFNIYYKSQNGNAKKFAEEMINSGIVDEIRAKKGNLKYEYFCPLDDADTILLIDSWESEEALDEHHESSTMQKIINLRNKYDLHMVVEKYIKTEDNMSKNEKYVKP